MTFAEYKRIMGGMNQDTPQQQPPTLPQQPLPPTQPGFTPPPPQTPQVPQPEAPMQRPLPPKKPLWESMRGFVSFAGFIISIILLALFINLFVFQSYYVDGTSMSPTLHPNDRLIINKIPKSWANLLHKDFIPTRGNIVVFNSPYIDQTGKPEQLIKRVIGLPGERVVVKNGTVTIYNKEHPEGFNPDKELNLSLPVTDGNVDITVPDGELFVCGDNRERGMSLDSRSDLGTVSNKKVVGELSFRIYPINKFSHF